MLLASTARIRSCCAFFAPPAQTTSRQNHHHCVVLLSESSSQRSNNDVIQSTINNNGRSSQSSSFQSKVLNKLLSSALVIAVALTSPINIQITTDPQHSLLSSTQQITSFSTSTANAYPFTENQQFINEIWSAVTSQYYDPSYNKLGMDGWISVKSNALEAVRDTGPDDEDIVNKAINDMLAVLHDPYTRYLSREKYEVLTKYAVGSSSTEGGGIGVQLLQDLKSNNVVIMGVIDDSPAYKAGLRVGDVIVKINDEEVEEGTSADVVAAKCRGEVGEQIELDVVRVDDNNDGSTNTRHVSMTRSKITPNPVKATIFTSDSNTNVGLLRIPSFTTETVTQMIDGLRSITTTTSNNNKKIDAIAIDLRGNVGGYMPAGVDASKLFLPARSKIIAEIGKSNTPKMYEADGIGAETAIPLYVLVDNRTASASEIFAAALQDNERAVIVGTTNTFGKGRIQNVKPLENGSGLAVTRARYVTPNGRDIHGVGIEPNKRPIRCEAKDSVKTCLAQIL
eukprot:scaffold86153_cov44-Cyclotella_meneghiniana.AAC.1